MARDCRAEGGASPRVSAYLRPAGGTGRPLAVERKADLGTKWGAGDGAGKGCRAAMAHVGLDEVIDLARPPGTRLGCAEGRVYGPVPRSAGDHVTTPCTTEKAWDGGEGARLTSRRALCLQVLASGRQSP